MYPVRKMIQDMEEMYHMFLRENKGFDYTCKRLREEYGISECTDEEDILEQLVFNIIIASMIVKEEVYIVEHYGMRIRKMLWEYEKNKENLRIYNSDNDMELIEDMINQINSCKNKMYPVQKMIQDMEEEYLMLLKEDRGIEYVFIRFWEDYDTFGHRNNKMLMLQTLVFDIIIADMNLKEQRITRGNKMGIKRMMREYEENKEKLHIYYDDDDMKLIEGRIERINTFKDKWMD